MLVYNFEFTIPKHCVCPSFLAVNLRCICIARYVARMGEKDMQGLGWGNLREGDQLADVGVHGEVIIKNRSLINRMGGGELD